ncbi:uncharacterized protein V1516DRAFT_709810 [Lipomyces oligophaga]|uniref:uncharacterized protein n=1 Tax=Lipomyces oligophaga TaxID=45792 RepID=UPI0034CD61D3
MTTLESIIFSLSESALSLSSNDFSRHENFTNAVLSKGDGNITSLIRDIDREEQQLLTIDPQDKHVMLRNKRASWNVSTSGVNKRMEDNPDADIDEICEELERLLKIYPAAVEIVDRINYYKERSQVLKSSISQYEQLVDQQKSQLDSVHSSSKYRINRT